MHDQTRDIWFEGRKVGGGKAGRPSVYGPPVVGAMGISVCQYHDDYQRNLTPPGQFREEGTMLKNYRDDVWEFLGAQRDAPDPWPEKPPTPKSSRRRKGKAGHHVDGDPLLGQRIAQALGADSNSSMPLEHLRMGDRGQQRSFTPDPWTGLQRPTDAGRFDIYRNGKPDAHNVAASTPGVPLAVAHKSHITRPETSLSADIERHAWAQQRASDVPLHAMSLERAARAPEEIKSPAQVLHGVSSPDAKGAATRPGVDDNAFPRMRKHAKSAAPHTLLQPQPEHTLRPMSSMGHDTGAEGAWRPDMVPPRRVATPHSLKPLGGLTWKRKEESRHSLDASFITPGHDMLPHHHHHHQHSANQTLAPLINQHSVEFDRVQTATPHNLLERAPKTARSPERPASTPPVMEKRPNVSRASSRASGADTQVMSLDEDGRPSTHASTRTNLGRDEEDGRWYAEGGIAEQEEEEGALREGAAYVEGDDGRDVGRDQDEELSVIVGESSLESIPRGGGDGDGGGGREGVRTASEVERHRRRVQELQDAMRTTQQSVVRKVGVERLMRDAAQRGEEEVRRGEHALQRMHLEESERKRERKQVTLRVGEATGSRGSRERNRSRGDDGDQNAPERADASSGQPITRQELLGRCTPIDLARKQATRPSNEMFLSTLTSFAGPVNAFNSMIRTRVGDVRRGNRQYNEWHAGGHASNLHVAISRPDSPPLEGTVIDPLRWRSHSRRVDARFQGRGWVPGEPDASKDPAEWNAQTLRSTDGPWHQASVDYWFERDGWPVQHGLITDPDKRIHPGESAEQTRKMMGRKPSHWENTASQTIGKFAARRRMTEEDEHKIRPYADTEEGDDNDGWQRRMPRCSLDRKVKENIRGKLGPDLFALPGHAVPITASKRSEGYTVLPINQIGKVK